MPRGIWPRRARPPAPRRTPPLGGLTFAEDPIRDARSARIVWHAALDPGTLRVDAEPADPVDPDSLVLARIAPWLTLVSGNEAHEHAVLSNGEHHIRLDVITGSLSGQEAVLLHFRVSGMEGVANGLEPLRRLAWLHRHRRFGASVFPPEPRMKRLLSVLRVHDAMTAGASHQEIGLAFFGRERVMTDWEGVSDSLRSRIRRLAAEASRMAAGGWRRLMRSN